MLKWKVWDGEWDTWNDLHTGFPDYSVYQSYDWGQHRSDFGWCPYRLIAVEDNIIVSMAQILVRKFPLNVALVWVPGGPVGKLNSWGSSFFSALKNILDTCHIYCRVSPVRKRDHHDLFNMDALGWLRPVVPLHTSMSLSYDPTVDEAVRLVNASQSWRHNLKRSYRQKYGNEASVWISPDLDQMLSVYESMWDYKNMEQQLSRSELKSIFDNFGEKCLVIRCIDGEGDLIALRGALLFGTKAWDIFAAASPKARKVYGSHLTFWTLINECAKCNVKWYDMGGVDPDGGQGVYNFKKGTGAVELPYLGEWDWASSTLLRYAANYMIKSRSRGL